MKIRLATMNDIDVLSENDKHIDKQELGNIIKLNRVYIAEENDNFIGWLRYNLFWDNTPFMNMLYIIDSYRGKGFGKQLVEYWEEQLKIMEYKTAMTSTASDEYAQHFYNKLGYSTVGGFLPFGESFEIILMKKL